MRAGGEPDRAALGLAELGAVGFGEERRGEAAGDLVVLAADEVDARGDVAPLVRAAGLEEAAVRFVEMKEVVGLQERVGELGEAEARTVQAGLDAVAGQHGVDGKMLSDVAEKIEDADGAHPVGVVDEERRIGGGIEIEQTAELAPDAGDIGFEDVAGEEIALGRLAARVADHAGGAARERDGAMAGQLEPAQDEEADEVAEVEAVGGRVEADVEGEGRRAGGEEAFKFVAGWPYRRRGRATAVRIEWRSP